MKPDQPEDPLEPMFAGVEPRPEPSEAARERAWTAVTEEWEELQARRARRRRVVPMAIAATVLVGILGTLLLRQGATEPLSMELAQGLVRVDDMAHRAGPEPAMVEVHPNSLIEVVDPARWETAGADVRVGRGTTFSWQAPNAIALHVGEVYVATEGAASFRVETPHGLVTDIGTRFLVSSDDDRLEVAVRDGQVELATPARTLRSKPVTPGQAQILVAESGSLARHDEAASNERWDWIHGAPRGYTTRNPVTMLRQIGRDLGNRVRFEHGVEAALQAEELDGDFRGMAPQAAFEHVIHATATKWHAENGVIIIALGD